MLYSVLWSLDSETWFPIRPSHGYSPLGTSLGQQSCWNLAPKSSFWVWNVLCLSIKWANECRNEWCNLVMWLALITEMWGKQPGTVLLFFPQKWNPAAQSPPPPPQPATVAAAIFRAVVSLVGGGEDNLSTSIFPNWVRHLEKGR